MAGQPLRSLRVPDHIWEAGKTTAYQRGESWNAAVVRLMAAYGGVDVAGEKAWLLDYHEVLSFAHILDALDWFAGVGDVLDYFDKPHKWSDLRRAWVDAGRPWPPSSDNWVGRQRDEVTEARWVKFAATADDVAQNGYEGGND